MAQMPDTNELLKRWPYLPDDAVVHTKVVAAVTGLSERTVRYDPRFKRVYLTSGRYGFRVGEVKRILTGATWQQLGDAAQRVVECSADIRDHSIKMQRELNRRREGGEP
jgi:hypothetical protein